MGGVARLHPVSSAEVTFGTVVAGSTPQRCQKMAYIFFVRPLCTSVEAGGVSFEAPVSICRPAWWQEGGAALRPCLPRCPDLDVRLKHKSGQRYSMLILCQLWESAVVRLPLSPRCCAFLRMAWMCSRMCSVRTVGGPLGCGTTHGAK